ncbi:(2Fe-2S)-binding protein [Nitrospirillum sp. BR 11163]|nr:(2Fe-2S)-binding protein [Nitrospirillum sp. BR 11163]MEA1675900.1 (2Fe-2S)-binding protein [Nitrospirillum sp. BR 11163]
MAEAEALAADPGAAEQARRSGAVCTCKGVDRGTMEDAIRAHGLSSVEDVRRHTAAGTGCGGCAGRVADVLASLPALAAE